MAAIGSPSKITSAVIVCNKKVITDEVGTSVISALLVLLAVHYTYELSYNPTCKSTLEFLQEKLVGDGFKGKRMSTSYCNLFRAINCIEQRIAEKSDSEDDDATQSYHE